MNNRITSIDEVHSITVEMPATKTTLDDLAPAPRFPVPEGQTPLNDNLGHRYLDVLQEGSKSRDNGTPSPYHGHSLEHCLHASGWVSRDLRLALDDAKVHLDVAYKDRNLWKERAHNRENDLVRAHKDCDDVVAMAESTRRQVDGLANDLARLRAAIQEAIHPDFIFDALDNVHDMDTTLDDYAKAVSRAIRAHVEGCK